MSNITPLSELIKPRKKEEWPSWVTTSAESKMTEEASIKVMWNKIDLEPIGEAIAKRSHPKTIARHFSNLVIESFPESAFCLIESTAPELQRVLAEDGVHVNLKEVLESADGNVLFPFLFDQKDHVILNLRKEYPSQRLSEVLEMIQSAWVWTATTKNNECFSLVIWGPDEGVPSESQINLGRDIIELAHKILPRQSHARLADEVAIESQGRRISAGNALLEILNKDGLKG